MTDGPALTLTDLGDGTHAVMFGKDHRIGRTYRLEDGYYYYEPGAVGVMSPYSMRLIADLLDELNRPWEETIANDPSIRQR